MQRSLPKKEKENRKNSLHFDFSSILIRFVIFDLAENHGKFVQWKSEKFVEVLGNWSDFSVLVFADQSADPSKYCEEIGEGFLGH